MMPRTLVSQVARGSTLLVVALLIVACGSRGVASPPSSPTARASPSAPLTSPAPSSPTALASAAGDPGLCAEFEAADVAEQVILRVYQRPMRQAPGYVEIQGATSIVYADGRIMGYGPQAAIAPGFAAPSLLTARLSAAGLADVIAAARATGLLDERARVIGQPLTSPFIRAEVVLLDGGSCRSVAVYVPQYGSAGALPMSAAVGTAVETLNRLTHDHLDLYSAAERGLALAEPVQPYDAERLRVVAIPAEQAPTDPRYHGVERAWPLATPLASFAPFEHPSGVARCAVIDGADLQTFRAALDRAMILDPWMSDGAGYILYLRPLWPGERSATACEVAPGAVAAVCADGTSAPFPTSMPDPLAEAVGADVIVIGTVTFSYPARWTTPDGARPGACGADPDPATIVTPVGIQIGADPLIGALDIDPNEAFIFALLPGGVPPTDQYVVHAATPVPDNQRVLVSLSRREPLLLAGAVATWDVRLILTIADDGTVRDPTGSLPDEAFAALSARIQAAAPDRVPESRVCEQDLNMDAESPPVPELEAHLSDLIVTGSVVEVLPARWTTEDGQAPPGSCWSGYGEHLIITPVVIDLDQPVMTHMGDETPSGRVVVAVFGGAVGNSHWSGWGSAPFAAGERVLISLYRQLYLSADVPTPAGTIVWETKMKFTLTPDGLAVGYPEHYAPEPADALIERIKAAAATAGLPTPTP